LFHPSCHRAWMTKPWDTRISDAMSDESWNLANASSMAEMLQLLLGKGKGKGRFASAGKGPKAVGKGKGKSSAAQTNCRCCGGWGHAKRDCMHWAKTCHTCGKKGHLSQVCNQEVERPPKDPLARTPGAGPPSYADALKSGKPRICLSCDTFLTADVKCCQRPGCKGAGKAAGKATSKGSKPAEQAAQPPKGGPLLASGGDPVARDLKIAKYKQLIAEGKADGMDMTSVEETLKQLCKEVTLPPTQYSEALAAKTTHNNKCNSLRQVEYYCKLIKEAEEEFQARNAGFVTKRLQAIQELEEKHKATLLLIDVQYDTLESDTKKKHETTLASQKEKMARHQADVAKIEAEAAPDAQEECETPDEHSKGKTEEEAPPAQDVKGALSSVLAELDEEARQAMALVMAGYRERLRLAALANDGDQFMDSAEPQLPGRVLEDGEEPPAQRAKLGA
jgi:hypothetical protein